MCKTRGTDCAAADAPVPSLESAIARLRVAQLLDGVSGTMLGVLTALVVADLTAGTGRFNLAQGFVGTISGVGASLSTTLSGLVVGSLGRAAGFLGIAAAALAALLLLWLLMPETHPLNRSGRL
jgi:sugar phosphate permease